ncbi:MAG: methyltransferase [Theionarchaea archaeon]|nr:methyltransferase [Theionarchaea archaeon]
MTYTCIGDIAVVFIPKELEYREHEIAETIYRRDSRVNVVVRRLGRHGEFRRQKMKVLLGDRTETVHTEYGTRVRVDVRETYFSEREKTERQRLKSLLSEGERILVLFAGIGIIPLILAKDKNVQVVAVEKNEKAFSFMTENIRVNRMKGRITPVLEDVYSYRGEGVDRVIVPQPYNHDCLLQVRDFVRVGGHLHYYTWASTKSRLPRIAGYEILHIQNVASYAPGVWKVCLDMRKL